MAEKLQFNTSCPVWQADSILLVDSK